MSAVVVDASAAVELVARTALGHQLAAFVRTHSVLWVPDGLFDVEVHAVLRRWDLRSVLTPDQVAASRLRLTSLRLTLSDACYVALAEALGCPLLTADLRLASAPNLPVRTLQP